MVRLEASCVLGENGRDPLEKDMRNNILQKRSIMCAAQLPMS